jgi:hypothetical protein
MPSYNFRNSVTGEEWTDLMSIADMQSYLAEHPEVQTFPGSAPGIVSGVNFKPDAGFREVLQKVKAAHPLGNVNTW